MAKYLVGIPELYYSWREVEANNRDEAEEKAWDSEEKYKEYEESLENYDVVIQKIG